MVEHDQLDVVFHALSDPTRRFMLAELAESDQSVGALAAPHAMSFAAASKHVRVLEQAGLLTREVRGRTHLCRLAAAPLKDAADFLAHYRRFWAVKLDALEAALLQDDERSDQGEPR